MLRKIEPTLLRGREIETHFAVHSQTATYVRTVFQYTDFNLPAEKMSKYFRNLVKILRGKMIKNISEIYLTILEKI